MPFIKELLQYKSCSIVGLEKNTGKTECLNYILQHLPIDTHLAVTSIGIDGESVDQVTHTAKPEIFLRKGVLFATSEKHYLKRQLLSEIYDVSEQTTSLGRVITAKTLSPGKILLSGPSSTSELVRWMDKVHQYGANLVCVDGALSRLSLASPAVSESMILSTGAAFSANINTLVRQTAYIAELIKLDLTNNANLMKFVDVPNCLWAVDEQGNMHNLGASSLALQLNVDDLEHCQTLYVPGAITDRFLADIGKNRKFDQCELVVRDFTRIFATPMEFHAFSAKHKVSVMTRSRLLAITVNPVAPNGIVLDSERLCSQLAESVDVPVYDLRKINN